MSIYVQCNPLLDISANCDEEFLKKYNVQPAAASLVTPEQMGIYADLEAKSDCVYVPGGSGLNSARVAQWLAQAGSNALVSYVGCIGHDDKYGAILKSSAEKEGVVMILDKTNKATTGTCAVCICGKERSLVANLAAANELSAEHMASESVVAAQKKATYFYLTGFTLTLNIDYVMQVATTSAQKGNNYFMFNLSAPFLVQFFGTQLETVLPYVDVLFGNEDEAQALSDKMGWDTKDRKVQAEKASAMKRNDANGKPRLVIFTGGKHPTVFCDGKQVSEVVVPLIDKEKIVDTNGAGDAFVGGFLAAFHQNGGTDVVKAIEAGHYSASEIIQRSGCSMPDKPSYTL